MNTMKTLDLETRTSIHLLAILLCLSLSLLSLVYQLDSILLNQNKTQQKSIKICKNSLFYLKKRAKTLF